MKKILLTTLSAFALITLASGCTGTPEPTGDGDEATDDDENTDATTDTADETTDDDEEPEPDAETGLRASVYALDPVSDGDTIDVVLTPPTSEDGSLTSDWVNALNCTQKSGGQQVGGIISLCVEEKTVFPDENGDYLHVAPPENTSEAGDGFAELMMYHHVNIVHDYFNGVHGFTDLDFPLDAVVNITFSAFGNWQGFPNAAFIPADSFAAFGLPERDYGAIMFGQYEATDFAYDATVIYHEYTHAVAGPDRFLGTFLDGQGLNNLPGSLAEGTADYFASTITDSPDLGRYALGFQWRDLEATRTCPEHLTTEIHADGKIIATALWAFRAAVGAEIADRVAFAALVSSSQTTDLGAYGELLLDAADGEGADVVTTLTSILDEHGVLACERVKPWIDMNFAFSQEGVPHTVEGTGSISLPDGVPGYHQWSIDVAAGEVIVLDWDLVAGGGFFGGAPQPVDLAVKTGSSIEMGFDGSILADAMVTVPFEETHQVIALGGNCVPAEGGTIFLTFVNHGSGASQISRIGIEREDAAPDGVTLATCD